MEPEPASDEGPPLNSGREFLPSTVKAADAGAALVGFLLAHWPHDDEAHWEAKVRAGCVAIDGAACADPGATLALNSRVVYTRPPWREPPVPSRWGVAFEDGDVVVLDKAQHRRRRRSAAAAQTRAASPPDALQDEQTGRGCLRNS